MSYIFTDVKAFSKQNNDLAEAMKEYARNYINERKGLTAFAQHSEEEQGKLINKAFAEELEKQSGYKIPTGDKVDKTGIVHTSIGKVSFNADQIRENAKEFISTLLKLKPSAAKGTYIKSIYLSSTMSAGIKIDPKSVEEN